MELPSRKQDLFHEPSFLSENRLKAYVANHNIHKRQIFSTNTIYLPAVWGNENQPLQASDPQESWQKDAWRSSRNQGCFRVTWIRVGARTLR